MRKSQKPPAEIEIPKLQQLLTIEEVSRVLNCSISSVHDLVRREGLPAIRLKEDDTERGMLRVNAVSLQRWLTEREKAS